MCCSPTKRISSRAPVGTEDRKSTRLNSSHANNSYAVFCLKKKIGGIMAQYVLAEVQHMWLDVWLGILGLPVVDDAFVGLDAHDRVFFFLRIRQTPRSTLFPYTTLFRSIPGEPDPLTRSQQNPPQQLYVQAGA